MNVRLVAAACLTGSIAAAAGCGHPMFAPPAGPGTPVADAASLWNNATSQCRQAVSYQARLRVSGSAGGQRIWPLSVETAVTADSSIYMSATAAGHSIFVLAGTTGRSTLWLPDDHEGRVVVAAPGAIVDAILGVELPPERLLAILSGCLTRSFDISSSAQFGATVAIQTPDARVFLRRDASQWRTQAAELQSFTVEVAREASSLPQKIWIFTPAGREPRAAIEVSVSEAEMNGTVPVAVFTPPAASKTAKPMTLDELRATGPWKERGSPPR